MSSPSLILLLSTTLTLAVASPWHTLVNNLPSVLPALKYGDLTPPPVTGGRGGATPSSCVNGFQTYADTTWDLMGLPYTVAYTLQACINVCASSGSSCAAAVWYNGNACLQYTPAQAAGQVMTPSPNPSLPRTLITRCTSSVTTTTTPPVQGTTPAPTPTPPVVKTTTPPVQGTTSGPATSAPTGATAAPTVAPATQPPTPPTTTGPRLVFQDEFNRLDFSVWEHELTLAGDGNGCFEQYTNNRTNSYVKNGILYLKPTFTADVIGEGPMTGNPSYTLDLAALEPAMQCTGDQFWGCSRTSTPDNILNPIQSAALRTAHSFSFKYGRVEVSAKIPRGDWIWPAIWMLPRYDAYGQWPMSGEIDIMESRGNAPGYSLHGNDWFTSTLHFGPYWPQDPWQLTQGAYQIPGGKSLADDFHTYGLYWDSTGLYTYIDNDANKVLKVNWTKPTTSGNYFYDLGNFGPSLHASNPWQYGSVGSPFDQEFYLIFNVAVGTTGGYFADDGVRPWKNDQYGARDFWKNRAQWQPTWKGDDVAMQIDWVRVWQ